MASIRFENSYTLVFSLPPKHYGDTDLMRVHDKMTTGNTDMVESQL